MIDGIEIFSAALDDFGVEVLIDTEPFVGLFSTEPKELVENGQSLWTDAPTLEVSIEVAREVELNASTIEIDDVEYQAFRKIKGKPGSVMLLLTRDF